jgi:hypothetical protein
MRPIRITIATLLTLLVPLAAAAAQRTFVSAGIGSDSNTCTRQLPCRNFNAAMAVTDAGGEVIVLDSGGYGAASIAQGVQLIAPPGVQGAITAFTGNAISIDAAAAFVKIRGLSLTGSGADNGIRAINAGVLVVENVSATNFTGSGLYSTADGSHTYITDSTFRRNNYGVQVSAASAATLNVNNVVSSDNTAVGFYVAASLNSVIANSAAVNNAQFGYSCNGGGTQLMLDTSNASHQSTFNTGGLLASNGCVARVSNCTFINNYNGLQNYANGATILTHQNNTIEGSTNPQVGTIGPYGSQ